MNRNGELSPERALRLLSYARTVRRARAFSLMGVILLLLAALSFAIYGVARSRFLLLWRIPLALALGAVALLALSALAFAILEELYGEARKPENRVRYINAYVRSLLIESFTRAAGALPAAAAEAARRYAETYAVRGDLYRSFSSAAGAALAGRRIVAEYERLCRELADPAYAKRFLAAHAALLRAMDKWCNLSLGHYAAPQESLIRENTAALIQELTERRAELLFGGELPNFFDLAGNAARYAPPYEAGGAKPLPRREAYEGFCTTVGRLKALERERLLHTLREDALEEYGVLFEEYKSFCDRYCTVGCETVDLDALREALGTLRSHTARCWYCGRRFSSRFHRVCASCGHTVCPKCGKCYCGKRITHRKRDFGNRP